MNEMTLRNELRDIFRGFGYDTPSDAFQIDLIVRRPVNVLQYDDLAWVETKKDKTDPIVMLSQLILTAKRANSKGNAYPQYFAVYDGSTFSRIETSDIAAILDRNEINWNEKPSSPTNKTIATVRRFENKIIDLRGKEAIRRWVQDIKSKQQNPHRRRPCQRRLR